MSQAVSVLKLICQVQVCLRLQFCHINTYLDTCTILAHRLTVMVSAVTLLAAATQPVWRSELKYSTVYPMRGEAPGLGFVAWCHETVTDDWVAFRIRGWGGGLGYVDGSGMRCRLGAAVFSTVRDADQDVSPLSELAVQVYNPESVNCKSENTV